MDRSEQRLPSAELEVMKALWAQRRYPVTSADLMAALGDKKWRTATLLTLLSRLEERGFVRREKVGRGNVYRPLVARQDYLAQESQDFLQRLHGGSLPSLVAALMESHAITPKDIQELEDMLKKGGI